MLLAILQTEKYLCCAGIRDIKTTAYYDPIHMKGCLVLTVNDVILLLHGLDPGAGLESPYLGPEEMVQRLRITILVEISKIPRAHNKGNCP